MKQSTAAMQISRASTLGAKIYQVPRITTRLLLLLHTPLNNRPTPRTSNRARATRIPAISTTTITISINRSTHPLRRSNRWCSIVITSIRCKSRPKKSSWCRSRKCVVAEISGEQQMEEWADSTPRAWRVSCMPRNPTVFDFMGQQPLHKAVLRAYILPR